MVSMFYAISIFHLNRKQIDIRAPLKMLITSLIFALGMLTQIDYPKLHRFYHFMRCVVFLSYWLFERIKVISAIFDIYFDYCSWLPWWLLIGKIDFNLWIGGGLERHWSIGYKYLASILVWNVPSTYSITNGWIIVIYGW